MIGNFGEANPEVATALNNLANIHVLQGDYSSAEALHLRALQIRGAMLGPDSYPFGQSTYNLAIVYEKSGQFSNAELFYKQAVSIWTKTLGSNHLNVANSLYKLANLYASQGHSGAAEEAYLRALEIFQANYGEHHIAVAESLLSLGKTCTKQEKYDEAEPFYRQALGIFEKELGPNDAKVAIALYSLANVYHIRGKNEEAFNREFDTQMASPAGNTKDSALSSQRHAMVRKQLALRHEVVRELYIKAEPLYKRAAAIFEAAYGGNHPTLKIIHDELAMLYNSLNPRNGVSLAD